MNGLLNCDLEIFAKFFERTKISFVCQKQKQDKQ